MEYLKQKIKKRKKKEKISSCSPDLQTALLIVGYIAFLGSNFCFWILV